MLLALTRSTRRASARTLGGKEVSLKDLASLIPWRSSRPIPFLDRQQSCIERVGVGTREDPFQ